MSTPAWKPLPSAHRITARTDGSRPAARSASARSNQPATGSALTGGLSIVIVVMCSRVSERIMPRRLERASRGGYLSPREAELLVGGPERCAEQRAWPSGPAAQPPRAKLETAPGSGRADDQDRAVGLVGDAV